METLYYSRMESVTGPLWIAVSQKGLVMIDWGSREFPPIGLDENISWVISEKKTAAVRKELTEYFDGHRTEFTVPLDLRTGTEFQRKCWEILTKIPYGETRSYLQVAKAAGRPAASRAVGQANHHNPIPIIIPCHRVINTDGKLGGYGGGLDLKEQLLALERALPVSWPLFSDEWKAKAAKP
jgi:methylated-DNA-[protein]-cysteine S-methyltransferase